MVEGGVGAALGGFVALIEIARERAMDLVGAIAAPSLNSRENEIRLFFQFIRSACFDGIERAVGRGDDTPIWTRSRDD